MANTTTLDKMQPVTFLKYGGCMFSYKDMSPPTKELMKLVLEQKITHGGHPILQWMMDNICIKTDPDGNIKPDKEKFTEKIDGAVALIMALDRALRGKFENPSSIYDERDLIVI